ncbi:helix-turn-helix domain-containing protein [Haloactinomyces albus]|uniref:Transcriptional regulator with XRE-family HTH domain n=1 Tax=Haloactinomyces albus TaxID=1352928 RepID=A0AAE3ZEC6_9ACTN|nr:helix-turn-helix transcriptional regulator [Haloactinomyces albus]MDR7302340.1 transcriptional regulator with XRE-family HTH domain [Haloactinomyces albus]
MASPIMRRKALGRELRKLRAESAQSLEEIAKLLGCSVAKVGHIETGRNSPSKPELMVLMDHFNLSSQDRAVFEEIRQEASQRGWWSTYRLPTWFSNYVGMETDALRVRSFELELMPGLLQTEGYARAVTTLARHMTEPQEVERKVELRMQRQQRLFEEEPLELITVISEAALHRCAKASNVSTGQLTHLIEMGKRPNVTINILPYDLGLHESMSGSFHLLDFPPDTWPSTAYQEYAVGGHLVDDEDIVSELDTLFAELREQALSEQDSVCRISEFLHG